MSDPNLKEAFKKEVCNLSEEGITNMDKLMRDALAELGCEMNGEANAFSKNGVPFTPEETETIFKRLAACETPACQALAQYQEEFFAKQDELEKRMAAAGFDYQEISRDLKLDP